VQPLRESRDCWRMPELTGALTAGGSKGVMRRSGAPHDMKAVTKIA
jgi:hypothetical protein